MPHTPDNLHWVKSSFSGEGGNNCVEVTVTDDRIALRESESPSEVLATSPGTLKTLLRSLKEESPRLRSE